jgi:hypothetical protein
MSEDTGEDYQAREEFEVKRIEEKRIEEKEEIEEAWQEVRNVLSYTRLEPNSKGAAVQLFQKYEGEVTSEQIAALKKSDDGTSLASSNR